jgi:hypothetical protein
VLLIPCSWSGPVALFREADLARVILRLLCLEGFNAFALPPVSGKPKSSMMANRADERDFDRGVNLHLAAEQVRENDKRLWTLIRIANEPLVAVPDVAKFRPCILRRPRGREGVKAPRRLRRAVMFATVTAIGDAVTLDGLVVGMCVWTAHASRQHGQVAKAYNGLGQLLRIVVQAVGRCARGTRPNGSRCGRSFRPWFSQ